MIPSSFARLFVERPRESGPFSGVYEVQSRDLETRVTGAFGGRWWALMRRTFRGHRSQQLGAVLGAHVLLLLGALPTAIRAQTDYYNTDAGRPVRIEDAYATERYAFELKLAPLRLERAGAGLYTWGIEPEIAYGVLPRTHIEVGLPLTVVDIGGGSSELGVAGVDLSMLHNLNTETQTLPAMGLRGDVLVPVGRFAPERAYASVTALLTRTWPIARVHLNGRYTFGASGSAAAVGGGSAEVDRWLAGLAFDRAFPLSAVLLIGEVYARQSIDASIPLEWHTGAGVRYQLSPRLAVDAGIGRKLTRNPSWYVTFGTAYAFGLRGLLPGMRR